MARKPPPDPSGLTGVRKEAYEAAQAMFRTYMETEALLSASRDECHLLRGALTVIQQELDVPDANEQMRLAWAIADHALDPTSLT